MAILILGLVYPYLVHSFDPEGPPAWSDGSPLVKVLVGVSALCGLLSLVLVILAVGAWKRRLWGLAGRAHFSLVTAAALCGSLLWLVVLGVA